jgi:hypothetical protein
MLRVDRVAGSVCFFPTIPAYRILASQAGYVSCQPPPRLEFLPPN